MIVTINDKDYEDTYGEDIDTSGKRDHIILNGIKKALYPVQDKKKKARNYVKLRKFEPITDMGDVNPNDGLEKKFIAYKQFKTLYNPDDKSTFKYKGLLFPLFIDDKDGREVSTSSGIKVHHWYKCGVGELKIAVNPDGTPMQDASLQVDSALGNLSYRPGWHLASIPLTRHIGKDKRPNGKVKFVKARKDKDGNIIPAHWTDVEDYHSTCSQYVWAKVEYSAKYDYTNKAFEINGLSRDKQKYNKNAYFTDKKDFENGFYHYKTSSSADDDEDWLIADAIRVLEVLSDEEVHNIVGDRAQSRWIADGSKNCKFMADFDQFMEGDDLRNMRESYKNNFYNKITEEIDDLDIYLHNLSEDWLENEVGAEIIGDGIYLYTKMLPYGNSTDYRGDLNGLNFMRLISEYIGGDWMFQEDTPDNCIKAQWFFEGALHSDEKKDYEEVTKISNKIKLLMDKNY